MGERDTKATAEQIIEAINEITKKEGGHYAEYKTQRVSWDDVQRDELTDGGVSSSGPNITDTMLASDEGPLYFVRPVNLNERVGKVGAHRISLLDKDNNLVPLSKFLDSIGQQGMYRDMDKGTSLHSQETDRTVGVRFQSVFIPIKSDNTSENKFNFHAEMYSYGTRDNSSPQNMIVFSTSQGSSIQYPTSTITKIYHHCEHDDGTYHSHTLCADQSEHKVGGHQEESDEQNARNDENGKANAMCIGIRAMGSRFNAAMTIQVPLKQAASVFMPSFTVAPNSQTILPLPYVYFDDVPPMNDDVPVYKSLSTLPDDDAVYRGGLSFSSCPIGTSNAARVSIGDDKETLDELVLKAPKRDDTQHVTVTIIMYYTVQGGLPSSDDVKACIDDMERLYESCSWNGRLNGEDDCCDLNNMNIDSSQKQQIGASFMKKSIISSKPQTSSIIHKKIKANQPFPVWSGSSN